MSNISPNTAVLSPDEKRALLARLLREKGGAAPPVAGQVVALFEAQARRTPDAVAVAVGDDGFTYRELDARANQCARHLRRLGVGPEVRVGLCVERSFDMVVALLGILKSGGAYVPLDPEYPAERLAYMLDDARAAVLLTQDKLLPRLPATGAKVVRVDADREAIDRESVTSPRVATAPENLAYVIYTSGSTGKPKGVQVTHGALGNFLLALRRLLGMTDRDRLLAVTTLCFDIAALELYLPLIQGARLHLASRDDAADPSRLAARLGDEGITFLQATPATWRMMLDAGWSGNPGLTMLCGGEALPRALADRLLGKGARLWNLYGPTETTIWSSSARVESAEGPITIGRPIAQTQMYVVDAYMRPVPVGVTGELYIGGAGLARGYLGRSALTAERFVPDPFGPTPGGRLYRTGDLARWRGDGSLECLGRVDHQVKVRGFRIELGEIEAALLHHTEVRAAAVVAGDDPSGEQRLLAYVVPRNGHPPRPAELRQFLARTLPDHMVPSVFVPLGALPLTPNGKVDRKALPAPESERPALAAEYVAPRDDDEATLARLWAEVLGLDRVGAFDNFFDLGGHSLLATQVRSQLRAALGVELPLRALFEAPTVAALAERVGASRRSSAAHEAPPIRPVPRTDDLPLSFAQQALWFHDQLAPGEPTFNVAAAVRIVGPLDADALERGFQEIVRRHEALRTTFHAADGRPVQRVAPRLEFALRVLDLRDWPDATRAGEAERLAVEEARRPFDLTRGPLVRGSLLLLAERESVVLLTMHHIVTDGWSFGVATRELAALYEAFREGRPSPLPALPVQYADYAHWQRERLRGAVLESLLAYWTRQLADVPPLELPTDRPRPPLRTSRGASQNLALTPALGRSLEAFGRAEGATTFMVLLAAFQTLLHRQTGQDDFAVGSPIANRNRAETEGLIGFFVNMIALRADLGGDPTFRQLLARVRQTALEAYEHQDLPLEVLIEALQPRRDLSRTPLFQVMFVLQNNEAPDLGRQDLALAPLQVGAGTGTAKFDLTLALGATDDGLSGGIEYNTDLFDDATITRLIGHFRTLLEGIAAAPDTRLSELPLLSSDERRLVLETWGAPPAPVTRPVCVHQLFEEQAERTPDALALVSAGARLTYRDLNARANRLARELIALGVGPEMRVGLFLLDPVERLIGILGVLKAGGVYVPLDPTAPPRRLAVMIADAGTAVLLTEEALAADLPEHEAKVVRVDAPEGSVERDLDTNPPSAAGPENLAYLIYTSGSTGQPKGVMGTHGGLSSAYAAWEDAFGLRERPTCHLQMAGFAFDVYTGDWVRALCSGGRLVACPRETLLEPEALFDLMRREQVDCAEFVPAVAGPLSAYLEQSGRRLDFLRLLVVGSDLLYAGDYERLRRLSGPTTRVVNSYGLTEATIDSTYFEGSLADRARNRPVPIGHPFGHARVYLLDRHLQAVAVGVPGEVHIAGPGLARGYHDKPGLTAERFLPNPFGATPGGRLYRTGDIARWLPDGNIELLGRADQQVKVRGFRIEPGEVEAVLRAHPGVREAVVEAREVMPGEKRMVAYVVPGPAAEVESVALRRWCQEKLPDYMVPSAFVTLSALPQSSNGKIDRRALPDPERQTLESTAGYVAPRDALEATLAQVWADVLGFERVGVFDNFFDLGGHSLQTVQLVARVGEALKRPITVKMVFQAPTVAALAEALGRAAPGAVVMSPGSPLVALQPGGTRGPLFGVHPVGGHVFCYQELARQLGPDQPFYGLQAAGLDGECLPETRVEAMAARYVAALRSVQAEGPYRLLGWSLGGVVAFEMARQLRERGEMVELLALIDSPPPQAAPTRRRVGDHDALTAFAHDLARGLGLRAAPDLSDLRGLDPEQALPLALERFEGYQSMRADLGPERLRRIWRVFRANLEAHAEYVARPYPGRLLLLRAEKSGRLGFRDPTSGWGKLAEGGAAVHSIPGDHYALLNGDSAARIAALLADEIARGGH